MRGVFQILLPRRKLTIERRRVHLYRRVLSALLKREVTLYSTKMKVNGACTCLMTYILVQGCSVLVRQGDLPGRRPIMMSASDVTLRGTVLSRCIPFLSEILMRRNVVRAPLQTIMQGKGRRFIYSGELRREVRTVHCGRGGTIRERTLLSLQGRCSVSVMGSLDKFSEELIYIPGFYPERYPNERVYHCRECLRRSGGRSIFLRVYGRGCLLTSTFRQERRCGPLLTSCQTLMISRTRGLPRTTERVFKGGLYVSSVQRVTCCLRQRRRGIRTQALGAKVCDVFAVVERDRVFSRNVGRGFRLAKRYRFYL